MANALPIPKILLVDDDPDIIELLEYNLQKEGFEIQSALDGIQALEVAKFFKPDLILLDVMMPRQDGIETARQLRLIPEFKEVYILFLTARAEEYTEVAAFDVGADDYIVKPIKPRALVSRIKAMFRRDAQQIENDEKIEIGQLVINRTNYSVLNDGSPLVMPKKEFELLSFLAKHPNKVFNRDELLEKVWGADVYVVERTVDVHIRKLREKIPEHYIKTLKGVGYMFTLED
ncbi:MULTISPECIES: response regulator transcription factor [Arcicella]|uniref:Response regulator transcription factor n=1 Tax=Arcicella aquatica TaxID=217141 RepID=A0ABU5QGS4_9BACT|nr:MULTISPECIES: response regulator transcription factor [Arcicella]MDR6560926.1 two-component system alkaline phosphatase synthesis response regulator PhoP [Arcicella sp. BE51]MDR6810810.1 two-component system alkaline phosphatase synthesis response regulator PhoP [Arcicella sp. BE140]MDR6822160.1 two-component system alkaline phosphatase synthesis response regulator PhoP [Arcicella sp. BE139]MEA5256246.1 response regulator transcription factor [Arcicella aquatica]